MQELIFTCGLPASGKSTWARAMEERKGYYWLSSDNIRKATKVNNDQVFRTMNETAVRKLKEGVNVIYDATNLWCRYRMSALEYIRSKMPTVFCSIELFAIPYEIVKERNSKRKGIERVPDEIMEKFIRAFQLPQFFEGWDNIHVNEASVPQLFHVSSMKGFNQDNPHHTLSLDEHISRTAAISNELGFSTLIWQAAAFHDIGKIYTKEIDNNGIAHYYGHENVSAYLFLLHVYKNIYTFYYSEWADILFLINYHMRPYQWTDKSYQKDLKLFGENRIRMLKQLHLCDESAH